MGKQMQHPTDRMLPARIGSGAAPALTRLAQIPEEEVWLASQRSPQTRRAYQGDVRHFLRTLGLGRTAQLRQVDRRAVLAWRRAMEGEGAKPRTIARRLAALSSLFTHLVAYRAAAANPVRDIGRPRTDRRQGTTAAFSPAQARALLDAPSPDTLQGLRDRALLSVGLQVGPRRAELVRGNQWTASLRRALSPDMVDRILRKYARQVGLPPGFSAHSMRATFITTTLQNGASLEDVQRAAGHADASTTKLYDRRGYNPEKAASFFATY